MSKSTQQVTSWGGSLTHLLEVEGELFKAEWCLMRVGVNDEQNVKINDGDINSSSKVS